MHIRIYFNDKPLFLADATDDVINEFMHHDDAVFIDELSAPAVNSMMHEMQAPKIHAGIFIHPNLDELKKAFWKKFTPITAAGGLVMNENDEVLLIFRRETWDLPKGKIDEGESIEECAMREVKEETGIVDLVLKRFLTTTYHTYREKDQFILKESHWFKMKASSDTELIPQTDEQITALKWFSFEEAKNLIKTSFPSIKDVFTALAKKPQVI